MRSRRYVVAVMSLLLALGLAACGSSSKSPASPGGSGTKSSTSARPSTSPSSPAGSSGQQSAAMITIKDFKYTVPASVAPGAKVSVKNSDQTAHTVTADSGGAFDDMAGPGSTTTFTAPAKPGTYKFHCTFHANMHGTLVVK